MKFDEAHLAQLAQAGDLDAFNRLVMEYQTLVYNLAYRIVSDANLAEDVTQSAFISAYTKIASYRGGSFRAWLLRITTNACYDVLRSIKRHPAVPLEPLDPEGGEEIESPHWLADDSLSPEEQAERAELDRAVQNCLDDLPEEFRTIVVMIDVQGMDYQEAAYAIKKPLGTIKSRLARARLKLRDCLQGFQELLPSIFRLEKEGNL